MRVSTVFAVLLPLLNSAIALDGNLSSSSDPNRIQPSNFKPPQHFKNTNLVRSINLEKGYVKENVNVVIENIDKKPQEEYYISFSKIQIDKVGGLEVRDKKAGNSPRFQSEIITYDPER